MAADKPMQGHGLGMGKDQFGRSSAVIFNEAHRASRLKLLLTIAKERAQRTACQSNLRKVTTDTREYD